MNTSKKIISIMIAVLMLTVCIAFTASAADEVITEASATITTPVPGEYLDMNPVSGDESKYTVTVEHCYAPYDSTYDTSKPFNYNTEYRVRILFTPKTGYTFDSSTVYKVNDQTNTGNSGYDGRLREARFRTPYPSTPEGIEYKTENNGTVSIMGYHGTEKNVVIPAEIEGKRVIEIYYEAFYGVDVKSIHIPAGVMRVEDAFMGCTTLESITVDENSTAFTSENGVLFSKDKAILVAYPAAKKDLTYTVPDTVKSLWSAAFAFNTNIKEVIIPEGVEEISYYVFEGCSSLEKLEIPDSVTCIRSDTLDGTAYYNNADNWENGILYCGNHLIEAKITVSGNYSIRPGTKTVAWQAFECCDNLTGIVIPDGVVYIGFYAFDSCTSLKSVTVPGSVKIIDECAFQKCTELEAVTIGSGVEFIEYHAFNKCESLKTVSFGKGLKEIGYESFYGCKNLESIVIPDGVETIGHFAFKNCTKLASVTLPDSVKIIRSDVFGNTAYYNDASNWVDGALYINNHLIEADVAGDYTVKEGTKTIASEAFDGNTGLNSVTLPDSLIGIGGGAFTVTNISDISIPSGLEYLGWNIVFNTPYANNPSNWENGLMYIDNCLAVIDGNYTGACRIKEGTRLIAESLFLEDEGVTSVVIPEGITEISEEMFAFSNIKSVTLPSSIKSVGAFAFNGAPLEINYSGSENSWNKIDFGRYNAELPFVKVNFLCPHKNTSTLKAVAATCTKTGLTEGKKCVDCGVTTVAQKTVAKKAHTLTTLKAVAATCTKTGLTEGKKCSVCGTVTVAQKTVAKKAHTLTTLKAVAATYKADGKTAGKKCTVCGTVTVPQKKVARKTLKKVSGLKTKAVKLASGTKTTLTLSWSKVTGAEKYQVQQYVSKKWKTIKTTSKTSYTVTKLKANKSYKFRVRAVAGKYYGKYSSTYTA
ncbi:MAG: leucine-rich repeat protein, partial [Clostridia bacterium]|nr:leucine-rich repeat protein [Clostridia bacterium]